jgi:hypothetical protein
MTTNAFAVYIFTIVLIEKFSPIKFYFQIWIKRLATVPKISRGFTSSAGGLAVLLSTATDLFHIHINYL